MIVSDQLKAELSASLGILNWGEIGAVVPFVLFQNGGSLEPLGSAGQSVSGMAMADIRLVPKVRLLDHKRFSGFGLAFLAPVHLPTGDDSSFNSDGSMRIEPRLAADWRHRSGVLVALNLGYEFRKRQATLNYVSDDVIRWGAAVEVDTKWHDLRIFGNIFGALPTAKERLRTDYSLSSSKISSGPIETLAGVRTPLVAGLDLSVAMGIGITNDVGTPNFRTIASLSKSFDFGAPPQSATDAIPASMLTAVEHHVGDGEDAPASEEAPLPPQPKPAEASDTYLSALEVPQESPDSSTVEEQSVEAAPEPDADEDGVPDAVDACPQKSGGAHLDPKINGCPQQAEELARATEDKIEIEGTVLFETASDVIREASYPMLDQVAAILLNRADIESIRIEGHTDSAGSEEGNLDLSQRRAAAVKRYLQKKGVAEERLQAQGLGETTPVASNDTTEGRAMNRRVEFFINPSK